MVQSFRNHTPVLHPGSWAHEAAILIGDVVLSPHASVWPTAVLRGDVGPIRIGANSNLQDGVICHDTTDLSETHVGERVTVGHRAILHGCRIGDDCLIGMGALIMDNATIGEGSFVAAGSLVPPGRHIPPGSFVLGSPARVIREVTASETEQIDYAWRHYVDAIADYTLPNTP